MSVDLAAEPVRGAMQHCPYKGLEPYLEEDRKFFFGRGADIRTIVSNMYAASLTVLCGPSGVGKTSVLLAGVVPTLRERQSPTIVFRTWQCSHCMDLLRDEAVKEIRRIAPDADIPSGEPLDKVLMAAALLLDRPIYVIFDQFEEYFIYQPPSDESDSPDAMIARAVNRKSNNTNFLISMRDDGLAKLGRFQARIPDVLGNVVRLRHLDVDAAREAIEKPVEVYNRSASTPVSIEKELVEAVIKETQPENVLLGETGQGTYIKNEGGTSGVETPFLQMVMMRLWEVERKRESSTLHKSSLDDLHGAKAIVLSHLNEVMDRLNMEDRGIAAHAFRFLVTPSGTKIAYSATDIAGLTGVQPETVGALFEKLARHDARILRTVAPLPERPNEPRFEIFHDVLAKAILSWSTRYFQELELDRQRQETLREKEKTEEQRRIAEERSTFAQERAHYALKQEALARKLRQVLIVVMVLGIVAVGSLLFAFFNYRHNESSLKRLEQQGEEARSAIKDANDKERSALMAQLAEARRIISVLSNETTRARQLAKEYSGVAQQTDEEAMKARSKAIQNEARYGNIMQQKGMILNTPQGQFRVRD